MKMPEEDLKRVLIDEVFAWSVGATMVKSDARVVKIIKLLRDKGKLLDDRGDGYLKYYP